MLADLQINQVDLLAPVPQSEAFFGLAVSLSADGDTALVGAARGEVCPGGTTPGCGAAYVYVRQGGGWSLEATLKPPGFPAGIVGRSVALSPDGTVALVGVYRDAFFSERSGVYVFVRNGTAWTLEKEILDPFLSEIDQFGFAMALSEDGSTALIADPFSFCLGGYCGETHVFSRDGGAWNEVTRLRPSDNSKGASGLSIGLSHDGNTALIGAPGAGCSILQSGCGLVHVFLRNGGTWSEGPALAPSDRSAGASFGSSVSLSATGDVAVIGASGNIGSGSLAFGSAYIFTRSGGTWTEQKRFVGLNPGDLLGTGVEISGNGRSVLIASHPEVCNSRPDCGIIYRSAESGGAWSDLQAIFSFPPSDRFTSASPFILPERQTLALSEDGETALVGAPQTPCEAGSNCGAAHVFTPGALSVLDIPALDGPGLLLLLLLLAGSGLWLLRRAR